MKMFLFHFRELKPAQVINWIDNAIRLFLLFIWCNLQKCKILCKFICASLYSCTHVRTLLGTSRTRQLKASEDGDGDGDGAIK